MPPHALEKESAGERRCADREVWLTGRRRRIASVSLLILVASLLYAWGIRWGLPSAEGWAADEIVPSDVLEAMRRSFTNGWHTRYPPLHYYLLAVVYRAVFFLFGSQTPLTDPSAPIYAVLFIAGRCLSLLMAAGVVLVVYRCARLLADHSGALVAAALVAFLPGMAYYAKLANLDVPYMFWWSLSLLFQIRSFAHHRRRDYLLFAVFAALALGTKDQAYGLYVLIVPMLVVSRYFHIESRSRPGALLQAVFGRDLWLAGLAGAAVLVAIHNPFGNPSGCLSHFEAIIASAHDFRVFDRGPRGYLGLFIDTARSLDFAMGGSALVLGAAGAIHLLKPRRDLAPRLSLLVSIVSYGIFFLGVILYCYDRFVLPVAVILSIGSGRLFAASVRAKSAVRLPMLAWIAATIVFALGRVITLDLVMANDSRRSVRSWLEDVASDKKIATIGPPIMLPNLAGFAAKNIVPSVNRLRRMRPDCLVINSDYVGYVESGDSSPGFFTRLDRGEAGYCLTRRFRYSPPLDLLDLDDDRRIGISNLAKINPLMRIYQPCESGGVMR